ncbi:MAG: MaoC family dehydratase [Myxococcota bacterium]
MVAPTKIQKVSDLKRFIGKPLGATGYTDWVEVTQDQIDRFAEATGDRQWIHVDPERAKRESPFGQTVAHGYLTLALAPALLPELLQIESFSMAINYGIDKMRLPAPVLSGSRVRMSAEIKSVRELRSGAARVTLSLAFEIEGGTKPGCRVDAIYVYYP